MGKMNSKALIAATVAMLAFSANGWADEDDGAEATIRLMGTAEAQLPDAVTKTITLPAHLMVESDDQVAAVDKAKNGHDVANQRREDQTTGQARAEEVRQQGKEMAEQAKEARENRGRADPPGGGRPENPGPPETPPGQQ